MTLDRPAKGNSLTRDMRPVVKAIWDDVRQDDLVRVLVITGSGERHFCTGADLTSPGSEGGTTDGTASVKEEIVWSALHAEVWKPIVCAVNGLVAGGGLHFVSDADIVVAGAHAEFMDTHTSVGMVGAVENIALTTRMPIGAVLQMTLMGRSFRMSAQRAYELGLVDVVVPKGAEYSTAYDIAGKIAANSPAAVQRSKQAIWSAKFESLAASQERGWSLAKQHRSHPDFVEGPRAFAEQRAPVWSTR